MKVFDMFAGIGGASLGLERAGMKTIGLCEIDKFNQAVLRNNFPGIAIFNDVKELCRWKWKKSKAQMLFRQAFHVRTYRSAGRVPDFQASVLDYSGRRLEPFAWYDHPSRCWRTWQRCLIEGWARFLDAWPSSGMTRNGIAYRLKQLVLRTSETGCMLWPTPTRTDAKVHRNNHLSLAKCCGKKYQQRPAYRYAKEYGMNPSCRLWAWLMGFPLTWTRLPLSETATRRKYTKRLVEQL